MIQNWHRGLTGAIVYPERDGKPMADNTKQARWILVLYSNLLWLFHGVHKVFVAADHLWYPVEGHPEICTAPDVYVVFGRDHYDRGSYQQWLEEDIPVTVVFEILSPGNSFEEGIDKIAFYEDHGVEELYFYNPDTNRLEIYVRRGELLIRKRAAHEFVSPRLGIRFDLSGPEMVIYRPDGRPFLTLVEIDAERLAAEQRADHAEQRADHAEQRADHAEQRVSQERSQRQAAEQRADHAEQRAARLAELSRKARRGQASSEELAELEGLEGE